MIVRPNSDASSRLSQCAGVTVSSLNADSIQSLMQNLSARESCQAGERLKEGVERAWMAKEQGSCPHDGLAVKSFLAWKTYP